jgi:hypothetical protein
MAHALHHQHQPLASYGWGGGAGAVFFFGSVFFERGDNLATDDRGYELRGARSQARHSPPVVTKVGHYRGSGF